MKIILFILGFTFFSFWFIICIAIAIITAWKYIGGKDEGHKN